MLLAESREHQNVLELLFALDIVSHLSILFDGSEILGFENCEIMERVHLKFCKILLQLKSLTPS